MIIRSALRTLRRDDASDERRRAAVADIDEEAVRLNRLVNDVLDFARPIRFDLSHASLRRICTEAASAAAGGESACRLDFAHGDDEVLTDAERLRQAFVNIVQNAREATVSGADGRAAVELRTEPGSDGSVRIVVADDGPGIAPEDLARVFEPYFTTKRTGSGIGLAITRNIIEGLGGRISVSSTVGVGTEVVVDLPRSAPRPAPPS
jgi:signal transduction histidine kinase